MNLSKLIAAGRVEPVLKRNAQGVTLVIGWKRPERSRKSQSWTLRKPKPFQAPYSILCETEGARRVFDERKRQITVEGYDPAHDDAHTGRELASAAWCYRELAAELERGAQLTAAEAKVIGRWPWELEWWKPSTDVVRNRERSGALYWAEADRLLRAGNTGEEFVAMLGAVDGQAKCIDEYLAAHPVEGGAS